MFGSHEEVESGILSIHARGMGRAKPIEVGFQFSQKICWCAKREKPVKL